ncbi:MAG: EAL domain-containing protein [Hyphomonas sp.]|nr:EAL domain-containing protein [Hyphomonas sp.]
MTAKPLIERSELDAYRAMLQRAHTPQEAVVVEQLRAITQNIIPLYLMLSTGAVVLGATFIESAPHWMTMGVPGFAVLISVFRIAKWFGAEKQMIDPDYAHRAIRQLEAFAIVLFVVMAIWVYMFIPYANEAEMAYLAFFTAFTGAAGTVCTMSRPRLVAASLLFTFGEYVMFFASQGERFYLLVLAQLAMTFFVFFQVSRTHWYRLAQSVMLQDDLTSESDRAARLANRNNQMALLDTLTGLPNRHSFFNEIDASYDPHTDEKFPIIGLIDLDGFKPINDVFGHTAGDAVLVETARRLNELLRGRAFVARLGGDEFAYILPTTVDSPEVKAVAEAVVEALSQPVKLPSGDSSRVSASVGYSSRAFGAASARELLEQADFALFRAKEAKAGKPVEFSASHAETKRREAAVHQAFKRADLDAEIHLVFQPIVESTSGAVVRWEALARWTSPVLGRVSPGEFVAVAEKAGMTPQMTRAVFRKALAQLKAWPDTASISVNLSAQDIISRDTTDTLIALLGQEEESLRERIVIEITESSLMSDLDEARHNLMRYRSLGVKIALDDFGTGYSSLRYLQELEFDIVKIDRSFAMAMGGKARSLGLVSAILQLCRSMGIECVIEGVETREQLGHARRAGCRLVQGYLYATPLETREASRCVSADFRFSPYDELLASGGRKVA